MHVASLGLKTDLMLIGWDGEVDELDGAIRACSPANPSFWFGNFLLFPDAPKPGDASRWCDLFEDAFAETAVTGTCLRWDRPDGDTGAMPELRALGFDAETHVVLQTSTPRPPPKLAGELALRRIESDADWAAVTELQIQTMVESWGPQGGSFARHQMARYRDFVEAGRGAWFGAFAGDRLVADAGVFVEPGGGLGRFQAVETAAHYRRRGACGTLVQFAAETALRDLGVETLVIVGLDDHTSAIYAAVGFEPRERLVAAVRRT